MPENSSERLDAQHTPKDSPDAEGGIRETAPERVRTFTRRGLLRGGLAAAPVVMTFALPGNTFAQSTDGSAGPHSDGQVHSDSPGLHTDTLSPHNDSTTPVHQDTTNYRHSDYWRHSDSGWWNHGDSRYHNDRQYPYHTDQNQGSTHTDQGGIHSDTTPHSDGFIHNDL